MKNNNKPITNVEIVQAVENTWEREIEVLEQELAHEIERTDNEGFYVAEEITEGETESNLAHQPTPQPQPKAIIDPKTGKPSFVFGIHLEQCYLTSDSFWTTALWRDGKEWSKKMAFDKVEGAKELLEKLENGSIRMVDDIWGFESWTNTKTKNRLKSELKRVIKDHAEGKIVADCFLDSDEWYI